MNRSNQNLSKVILIGRPNVGKSTLFNRLVGKKLAIEAKEAGTTRDWQIEELRKKDFVFNLIDSAGLSSSKDHLGKQMQISLVKILKQADLIIWVVDGQEGLKAEDLNWQKFIRSQNRPTWLVVNKVDNLARMNHQEEFQGLGFKEVFYLSALHNKNLVSLEKKLWSWVSNLPQVIENADQVDKISFAIKIV